MKDGGLGSEEGALDKVTILTNELVVSERHQPVVSSPLAAAAGSPYRVGAIGLGAKLRREVRRVSGQL